MAGHLECNLNWRETMKTNAKIALLSLLLAYIELAEDSDFVVKNFESLQQKQQAKKAEMAFYKGFYDGIQGKSIQ